VPTRQGEPVQIIEAWKGARDPAKLHYVFASLCGSIICSSYKLTLSDQAQVTLTENQSFRFSVKIFSRSALAGRDGGPVCVNGILIVGPVLTFGSECWLLTKKILRTFETRILRRILWTDEG
jgi:hypothetical protein